MGEKRKAEKGDKSARKKRGRRRPTRVSSVRKGGEDGRPEEERVRGRKET